MLPIEHNDPLNSQILAISEDKIQGFVEDPFVEIARLSGVPLPQVLERIQGMLAAGTIRRVRQTLVATQLADGALVAWRVPEEKLNAAFDFMFQQDPFLRPRGGALYRSADAGLGVPSLDDAESAGRHLDG
jgi:DNA-binding Lrp family transcriptional regulator